MSWVRNVDDNSPILTVCANEDVVFLNDGVAVVNWFEGREWGRTLEIEVGREGA